jgi:hypothetical protein
MATTRRNAMLIAEAREKIRTTQLINRLQNHALGELEMSATQITATAILLKKILPDVAQMQLQGDADNPIEVNVTQAERRRQAREEIDAAFPERVRDE